jgi:hypothetical protein
MLSSIITLPLLHLKNKVYIKLRNITKGHQNKKRERPLKKWKKHLHSNNIAKKTILNLKTTKMKHIAIHRAAVSFISII